MPAPQITAEKGLIARRTSSDGGSRRHICPATRPTTPASPAGEILESHSATDLAHLQQLIGLDVHHLPVGLAGGKLWGYEGSILVTEGQGFCNSFQQYDTYSSGPLIDSGDLSPLCIDLEDFRAEYEPDLTASSFTADIRYGAKVVMGAADWDATLDVGRTPVGHLLFASVAYPFVGETGRWAFRQTLQRHDRYFEYLVPTETNELVRAWYPESRTSADIAPGSAAANFFQTSTTSVPKRFGVPASVHLGAIVPLILVAALMILYSWVLLTVLWVFSLLYLWASDWELETFTHNYSRGARSGPWPAIAYFTVLGVMTAVVVPVAVLLPESGR